MQDNKTDAGSLPIPAIMLFAAIIIGGFVSLKPRLESARPTVEMEAQPFTAGDEHVPARLWQDPFKAAGEHRRLLAVKSPSASGFHRHGPAAIATQIASHIERGASGERSVLILPVMVSGLPYAEDAERRLRSRYAVTSALSVTGYRPENATHIGYFEFEMPMETEDVGRHPFADEEARVFFGEDPRPEKAPLQPRRQRLLIPYEWFIEGQIESTTAIRPEARVSSILVLWLPDEALKPEPLGKLRSIMSELSVYDPRKEELSKGIRAVLLGPGGSTTLRSMMDEVLRDGRTYVQALVKKYASM